MLNSTITTGKRQQVDDFNTVVASELPTEQPSEPPSEPPTESAEASNRRPGSAASDPGAVRSGGEGESVAPAVAPAVAPNPTPTPSLTEEEPAAAMAAATAASLTPAESPRLPPDDRELLAGSRPANTPTTPCAADASRRLGGSRPSQRTSTSVVQQRMYYDHAVNLVSARCASDPRSAQWLHRRSAQGLSSDPPPGFGAPSVFYVRQQRPRPMTPLKAWAGYHGNVYFTPLRIEQSEYSHPDSLLSLPSLPDCSDKLQRVLVSSRLNADHVMQLRARAAAGPRQPPRRRKAAVAGNGLSQPVVQLDLTCLTSATDPANSMDCWDAQLQRSANATGTLQFQHQLRLRQHQQLAPSASSRVYRGSVSRKLRDLRQAMGGPQPQEPPHQVGHTNSLVNLDKDVDRPRGTHAAQQRIHGGT